MLSALSGSRVCQDEHEAKSAYPYVAWEHPQMYPGLMVPNWAILLRQAADRCGLSGFGRELLRYVSKMFPREQGRDEEARAEALYEAETHEDYERLQALHAEQDREDLERERVALEAVAAAIAVFDLAHGVITEQLRSDPPQTESEGRSANAREALAMKVCDVLEAGGMVYASPTAQGPYRADVPPEERRRINADAAKAEGRSKLLVSVRIPGRNVPRARFA